MVKMSYTVLDVVTETLGRLIPNVSVKVYIDIVQDADVSWLMECCIEKRKPDFCITMNFSPCLELSEFELVEGICHECVHIAQYVTGVCATESNRNWLTDECWESDDEVQARDLQKPLAKMFLASLAP